jgi:hypothetical protein
MTYKDITPSDADRQRVVTFLFQCWGYELLTTEEYYTRTDHAWKALTYHELEALISDREGAPSFGNTQPAVTIMEYLRYSIRDKKFSWFLVLTGFVMGTALLFQTLSQGDFDDDIGLAIAVLLLSSLLAYWNLREAKQLPASVIGLTNKLKGR